ncbi:DUF2867 domain-containing protein [Oharaeibacter diazotrophicus]|uniref:Uncharacterized protein DUF2867 n=1 Tax=Oharaeibacter diazotrophicus TaxID=1920512 RepID=A0A4R6RJX2_9HYPH|nr:DUF2867 domain-containing protein [Oharaeibacter diazotrophicus]TDP86207.1 uncharacterized protein DUF2867 [Oharaeibacter diazotrophicus]BBE71852.1 hypothetical protein OHA_1_01437 [Pleomorphomonas sp. SM30]GLS78616.1 hypothetical protein GCM10007904_39530 [Oharaeibacter diazotrophicus]
MILAARPGTGTEPPLVAARDRLAFLDARSLDLPVAMTALGAWNRMIGGRMPLVSAAMRLRDAVCRPFGIAPIGGFRSDRRPDVVRPGDRLDFFTVEDVADDRLVLTVRDHHLDVMNAVTIVDRRLTVTTSVVVHNALGRLYMLPVGPAHRLIARVLMARFARSLAAGAVTR